LVEGGLEITTMGAVQKGVRGSVAVDRVRRSASQSVAVKGDSDPLRADRGVDEVHDGLICRAKSREHVRNLAQASGSGRSPATDQKKLLHEASPRGNRLEVVDRSEDLFQASSLGRELVLHSCLLGLSRPNNRAALPLRTRRAERPSLYTVVGRIRIIPSFGV
jgi:hypothetical protein